MKEIKKNTFPNLQGGPLNPTVKFTKTVQKNPNLDKQAVTNSTEIESHIFERFVTMNGNVCDLRISLGTVRI